MKYVMTTIAVLSFASFANAHDGFNHEEISSDWSYGQCMSIAERYIPTDSNPNADYHLNGHLRRHCRELLKSNQ